MVESDEEIIDSYVKGDIESFNRLYNRHKDDLFRFCCFMMKDVSKAEDILQKAFIRFFENAGKLSQKTEGTFKPWMFSVVANLCKDEFKRAETKRTQSLENPDYHLSKFVHHEQGLENEELSSKIDKAIDQLPEKLRQVIGLQYYAELDLKEISKVLKIPEGTVKSRLFKAKEGLARMLRGLR